MPQVKIDIPEGQFKILKYHNSITLQQGHGVVLRRRVSSRNEWGVRRIGPGKLARRGCGHAELQGERVRAHVVSPRGKRLPPWKPRHTRPSLRP